MTKYTQLRDAFGVQREEERQYWQSLQLKAAQLTSGLRLFLELPSSTYKDLSGKAVNYIQLRKHGGKEEVHFTNLEGAMGAIEFDIAVTLEVEEGAFPKSIVSIPFKIGKTDEAFAVWSDTTDVAGRIPFDSSDHDEIYEQIFQKLKNYLSQRPKFELPR